MQDEFQRKIEYIRISVTDRCNFRCTYCMPEEGVPSLAHDEILTFEEIERLCKIFASIGIRKVKITGGEPLVRKGVVHLIESLKQIDGIDAVTMTSNGSLLKEHLAELKTAGLDGINISLDSLNKERFATLTRRDELANVLQALGAAVDIGIPSVKINCVPMRGVNEDELVQIAALAKGQPIIVRFIELMPMGIGKSDEGMKEDEIRKILEQTYGKLDVVDKPLGNGPAHYFHPEGFKGYIGFISAISHKFCGTCNRIRLTSDGRLKPCLQYAGQLDLRALLRSGASDEEVLTQIKQSIASKPECHQFEQDNSGSFDRKEENIIENRTMTQIGG